MQARHLVAVFLIVAGLAILPAYAQFPFPSPTPGNESTTSFGGFVILVDPHAAPLFAGCPAPLWNGTTRYLTSPLLYDFAGTTIGVSAITSGSSAPTGNPPTTISEPSHPPAGFSGAGPRIYTQIRALPLRTYSSTDPMVTVSVAPAPPSAGEVRPDTPTTAKSFFEAHVQITLAAGACPGHPAATLYNKPHEPLILEASGLTSLPPSVVYNHMASNEVPIYIRIGRKEEFLGCIILAAHQVGVAGIPVGGGGGNGGPGGKKGKGPPEQAQKGREEFEKQKGAFEAHLKEAERGMPHNCKAERGPEKAQ